MLKLLFPAAQLRRIDAAAAAARVRCASTCRYEPAAAPAAATRRRTRQHTGTSIDKIYIYGQYNNVVTTQIYTTHGSAPQHTLVRASIGNTFMVNLM